MKRIVLLTFFATLISASLFGWGPKGHDIVAAIAEANLSCKAKRNISKILQGRSIIYYSSWMDNLQNSPKWQGGYDVTKTWHYANVEQGHTYLTTPKEPRGDVLTALDLIIPALTSTELNDSLRSDYLKMLVHLVGDMHCPMHAGRLSDRGGNNFRVQWFGRETNLHSVWDTYFIDYVRKWSYTEWQQQLDRKGRKERAAIAAGTPAEWFDETVSAAVAIYASVTEGESLGYGYMYDNSELLERQLLCAGYRLARLLNEIFG